MAFERRLPPVKNYGRKRAKVRQKMKIAGEHGSRKGRLSGGWKKDIARRYSN